MKHSAVPIHVARVTIFRIRWYQLSICQRAPSRVDACLGLLTAAPARLLPHSTPCQLHDHLAASHALATAASWCSQLPQDNTASHTLGLCQLHGSPSMPRGGRARASVLLSHAENSFSGLPKINFSTEPFSCTSVFIWSVISQFFFQTVSI